MGAATLPLCYTGGKMLNVEADMKRRSFRSRLINLMRTVPIFPRLLSVFCVLLVLSTLFITLINQRHFGREAERTALDTLKLTTRNAAYKLDQETTRIQEALALLLRDERLMARLEGEGAISPTDRAAVERALLSAQSTNSALRALILIVGEDQVRTAAGPGTPRGPYFRDLAAFYNSPMYAAAEAAKGYPAWVDATRITPECIYANDRDLYGIVGCLTLCYKVYSPRTLRPIGHLVACVLPGSLTAALPEYASRNGGNTFLVGNAGLVEGIFPELSAPPFPAEAGALIERAFAEESFAQAMEVDGRALYCAMARVNDLPLAVIHLSHRDHSLRPVRQMAKVNLIVAAGVIAVGIAGFYLSAMSIALPLGRLSLSMVRVGHGDFSTVYRPDGRDEITSLALSFNRMVEDMRRLIEENYGAKLREKSLKLSEKSARLDRLQMQISPHFLYNTLDAIRWQALDEGGVHSRAGAMIERFSALMRMTIRGDHPEDTLSDELRHAETYLEVVNFRFSDPIALRIRVAQEAEGCLLPCMTLQPIIENAVRHGFSGKETIGRVVTIRAEIRDDRLVIVVSDNGGGMRAPQLTALRARLRGDTPSSGSIGLRNVAERLHLRYGPLCEMRIESEAGMGTSVTLICPVSREEGSDV